MIALLICYIIFTIIIYCVAQCFFGLLCVVVLALSVTLYSYSYYLLWWKTKRMDLWLEAVAWTRRHCHYFLFWFFFFSVLSVKYLTYLTGFHCPVLFCLSLHNPNVVHQVYPRLNAEHSSIIGWSYNGEEFGGVIYFMWFVSQLFQNGCRNLWQQLESCRLGPFV